MLGDRGSWLDLEQQSAGIAVRPQLDCLMDGLANGRSTTSLCARQAEHPLGMEAIATALEEIQRRVGERRHDPLIGLPHSAKRRQLAACLAIDRAHSIYVESQLWAAIVEHVLDRVITNCRWQRGSHRDIADQNADVGLIELEHSFAKRGVVIDQSEQPLERRARRQFWSACARDNQVVSRTRAGHVGDPMRLALTGVCNRHKRRTQRSGRAHLVRRSRHLGGRHTLRWHDRQSRLRRSLRCCVCEDHDGKLQAFCLMDAE